MLLPLYLSYLLARSFASGTNFVVIWTFPYIGETKPTANMLRKDIGYSRSFRLAHYV